MKIKINDKEIELTPEQVKILGEEVKKEKKGLWKPEMEEKYFVVNDRGDVNKSWMSGDIFDQKRYSIGNVYKTEAEAQAHVEKLKAIQRVKEYIAENCEVVEDVMDTTKEKFYVTYNPLDKSFGSWYQLAVDSHTLPYLKTEADADKVIANCKADLKIIWGIK